MPSKKTAARVGVKGAKVMARHPRVRRATIRAARPTAKAGWKVGKVVAKRKVRQRVKGWSERIETVSDRLGGLGDGLEQLGDGIERLGGVAQFLGQMAVVYGPPAAEVFGLIEAPKPRRTAPALMAGIAIGAVGVYFLEPEHGPDRRRRVQKFVAPPG